MDNVSRLSVSIAISSPNLYKPRLNLHIIKVHKQWNWSLHNKRWATHLNAFKQELASLEKPCPTTNPTKWYFKHVFVRDTFSGYISFYCPNVLLLPVLHIIYKMKKVGKHWYCCWDIMAGGHSGWLGNRAAAGGSGASAFVILSEVSLQAWSYMCTFHTQTQFYYHLAFLCNLLEYLLMFDILYMLFFKPLLNSDQATFFH